MADFQPASKRNRRHRLAECSSRVKTSPGPGSSAERPDVESELRDWEEGCAQAPYSPYRSSSRHQSLRTAGQGRAEESEARRNLATSNLSSGSQGQPRGGCPPGAASHLHRLPGCLRSPAAQGESQPPASASADFVPMRKRTRREGEDQKTIERKEVQ